MRIDQITLDDELQPRAEIDDQLCAEYLEHMRGGTVLPPVTVFHDGQRHLLADGFHRVEAARMLGFEEIDAVVQQGGFQAALRFSLAANATHGQRRKPGDYRRAYDIGVANQLFDATDQVAVASTLQCSQRWAQVLTEMARLEQKTARNAAILAAKAEGRSNGQIATDVGLSKVAVGKIVQRHQDAPVNFPHTAESLPLPCTDPAEGMASDALRNLRQAAAPPPAAVPSISDPGWLASLTEQQRENAVALMANMNSPRGERWGEFARVLNRIAEEINPEALLADPDPQLHPILRPKLERAFQILSTVHMRYDDV